MLAFWRGSYIKELIFHRAVITYQDSACSLGADMTEKHLDSRVPNHIWRITSCPKILHSICSDLQICTFWKKAAFGQYRTRLPAHLQLGPIQNKGFAVSSRAAANIEDGADGEDGD